MGRGTAREHNLPVLTRDEHFETVDELAVVVCYANLRH